MAVVGGGGLLLVSNGRRWGDTRILLESLLRKLGGPLGILSPLLGVLAPLRILGPLGILSTWLGILGPLRILSTLLWILGPLGILCPLWILDPLRVWGYRDHRNMLLES